MDRFDVWLQHIDKIPSCQPDLEDTHIFRQTTSSFMQMVLNKRKRHTLDNKLQKSISFDYFAGFLKGNPNSTYLQSVVESYGFPTSRAEERILIGPQLSHGLNNQSAVEFPFNQHQ